jgi:hypothetical protein
MPMPDRYRQQLIESHESAEREASHATLVDLLRATRDIVFWTILGFFLMGFALHVGDEAFGRVFWWLGQSAWFGGVTWSIAAAYRRGERRGDW